MSGWKMDAVQAVVVVARLLKQLDDACPDVGMGPSWDMLARQACKQLQVEPMDEDMREVMRRLKKTR